MKHLNINEKFRAMKTGINIVLLIFITLNYSFCLGQEEKTKEVKKEKKTFRGLFTEAGYHIEFKNYMLALSTYLTLDSMEPGNSNIQYRIGSCYLHSTTEKTKAIPYLEKAITNTSRLYDDLSYTEKNAPQSAYYELARAYHLNYQLDTAIGTFKKYKSLLHKKHYMQSEIDRNIKMCEYAKEQIKNPINVEIVNMGSGINSQYADYCPVINADETTMIFTSRREGSTGGLKDDEGRFFEDIYVSNKDSGKWSEPVKIGSSINTRDHDAAIGLSADGQRLFIYKEEDIYQSYLMGETWTVPERMSDNINSDDWETHASITPDGKLLYFVSDRKGGQGKRDIYRSEKLPTGEWGKAENLGTSINTEFEEDAPFIHPNGKTLYFSSKGHNTMGGFDIFYSQLSEDGNWSEPVNIGYPINTTDDDIFYVESSDGKRAYYSSFDKSGLGEKDIYMAVLKDQKEIALTVLKGTMSVVDLDGMRSEERRVGKECRSRWSP